jgi:hypothetical protein
MFYSDTLYKGGLYTSKKGLPDIIILELFVC